ncbi:hypothetical protein GWK08_09065 [Leptobacterium flavescens]|uniref:Uncharacterized protein n=1 Tax=Leptobacterium flavescens TaxID=472055 RepID=A0A6P0UJV2_9FLAO|nr:hypothetical protein [Leptobacterium flavescens]NER13585.1 hypothetical protein [Leptobacterium flavescens]
MSKKFNKTGFSGRVLPVLIAMSFTFLYCENTDAQEKREKEHTEQRGEHRRDRGESREGEEDGTQLRLNETYKVSKRGVRLILSYDKKSNSFLGSVENVSRKLIKKVRVEVHLSNGTELGPTIPVDLKPKMKKEIVLKATKASFKTWSTHAEIGNSEHGHGHGKGEHDGKESKEHQ